jgi:benzoyl-CoA reductase/2-hydroxyglutaryl-CoA dehydratase subunit BcrC/BadD/HgdB
MDFDGFLRSLLWERQRWNRVLSSPLTYSLLNGFLRLTRASCPLDAVYRTGLFALNEIGRAYTGKAPVVWSSAYFPVELVWSLDLCPFSPEVAAAYIAELGFAEETMNMGEQAGYSRDICSFHRCIAGAAAAGNLPRPTALLSSTQLCDGAPLLFQNLSALYKAPALVLDVPYNSGPEAEHYVAGQLEQVWLSLAELTGQRPDPARLAEAVSRSEEFRVQMQRVNELRCRVPSPVYGIDMLGFIYLFFIGQGSREAAEISATLASEIESACKAGVRVGQHGTGRQSGARPEKYRLLWMHLKPYYSNELMNFVEQQGAVLAMEEFSHIYWPPLDPEQPFFSLARKLLSHFAFKPVTERIRVMAELAREYRVDGIVHFSHHGCRQASGGALMIKEALQEEGWPVLVLEGDCVDGRNEACGGMLTRLQAFMEILQERKLGW